MRERRVELGGMVCFVLVCLSVWRRLFFGVDLSDEAYYAALPWAFSLGHTPLVDEWAIHQLAALLTWPAVEIWTWSRGSTEGLILFLRHVHLAAAIATALVARSALARLVGPRWAWPIAAIVVAYVPFHIPAPSYNTIASLGLTAGVLLLARAVVAGSGPLAFAVATIVLALSSFAYPPMIAAAGLALSLGLLAVARTRPRTRAIAIASSVAAVGGGLAVAVVAWLASLGGLAALEGPFALHEALGAQGGGVQKLAMLVGELQLEGPFFIALALWMNALLVLAVIPLRPASSIGLTCALAIAPWLMDRLHVPFTEPDTTAPFLWSGAALLSAIVVLRSGLEITPLQRSGLRIVAAPALLAGAVIAWSTANGLRNATLGLLPAALVTFAVMARAIEQRGSRETANGRAAGVVSMRAASRLVPAILIGSLLAIQLVQLWRVSYRDGPVEGLGTRVEAGPWKGIYTRDRTASLLATLATDLERVRGDAETWTVYDYFPAGYLFADLRPMTHTLWTFPGFCCQGTPEVRAVYARRFEVGGERPDLVFENRCRFQRDATELMRRPNAGLPPDPLVTRLFAARYRRAVVRPCYVIHERVEAKSPSSRTPLESTATRPPSRSESSVRESPATPTSPSSTE